MFVHLLFNRKTLALEVLIEHYNMPDHIELINLTILPRF